MAQSSARWIVVTCTDPHHPSFVFLALQGLADCNAYSLRSHLSPTHLAAVMLSDLGRTESHDCLIWRAARSASLSGASATSARPARAPLSHLPLSRHQSLRAEPIPQTELLAPRRVPRPRLRSRRRLDDQLAAHVPHRTPHSRTNVRRSCVPLGDQVCSREGRSSRLPPTERPRLGTHVRRPEQEQAEGAGATVRRSIGTPQLRNFTPFL